MSWEVAVVLGHVGISALWFYLSLNLDEEHFFIRLLFFFLGLISMWSLISQIYNVANYQSTTPDSVLAIARTELYIHTLMFFGVIIYFMIWFVVKWYRKELGPYMKPMNKMQVIPKFRRS